MQSENFLESKLMEYRRKYTGQIMSNIVTDKWNISGTTQAIAQNALMRLELRELRALLELVKYK
jgi:hypothetical protein